jgi:hypothetical protein
MTKAELEIALEAKRVPKQMYSLGSLKDGECYGVLNTGNSWKVVYVERGRSTDIATGLSENSAYDALYNEFRSIYGWA